MMEEGSSAVTANMYPPRHVAAAPRGMLEYQPWDQTLHTLIGYNAIGKNP
jgi:hypothetical protein